MKKDWIAEFDSEHRKRMITNFIVTLEVNDLLKPVYVGIFNGPDDLPAEVPSVYYWHDLKRGGQITVSLIKNGLLNRFRLWSALVGFTDVDGAQEEMLKAVHLYAVELVFDQVSQQ